MRVLFIVPYVPSLVRVRPYQFIRSLQKRGNQVTIATVWTGDREKTDLEQLRSEGANLKEQHLPRWRSAWNCLMALPSNIPLQAVYSWQPALVQAIKDGSNKSAPFDVIHVEHLRGARYALNMKALFPGTPVVWDSVDCISYLFSQAAERSQRILSRWITRFELGRTAKYEGWLVRQFDRTLVTSRADRDALLSLAGNHQAEPPVMVLPNGVDLEYFTPGPEENRLPATLVVSGKMSYHANVSMVMHLVEKILPRVKAKRPDVEIWVVGKDPPKEIQALAADPAIKVTGTVADLRPYLQGAAVAVAPLTYGAGIQNKVLEAMACATPVVASKRAVAALGAKFGEEILVADNDDDFAQQTLKLLDDVALQHSVGKAGRQFVERFHRWDAVAGQLEGIYHEIIRRSH